MATTRAGTWDVTAVAAFFQPSAPATCASVHALACRRTSPQAPGHADEGVATSMSRSMSDRDKHWATTRWTLLQALDGQQTSMAQEALRASVRDVLVSALCIRAGAGHNQDEASDLVQDSSRT